LRFSYFLSLLLLNILYMRAFAGGFAISLSIYMRVYCFSLLYLLRLSLLLLLLLFIYVHFFQESLLLL